MIVLAESMTVQSEDSVQDIKTIDGMVKIRYPVKVVLLRFQADLQGQIQEGMMITTKGVETKFLSLIFHSLLQ